MSNGSIKNTFSIDCEEQYRASRKLHRLLIGLGLKSLENFESHLDCEHDFYTDCGGECGYSIAYCECEGPNYNEYDDGASFEDDI